MERILDLLPEGKDNAISAEMLCSMTGIATKRELQKEIARERKNGALILSVSTGGYYTSHNREEILSFMHTLENRAKNTLLALRSARRYLKRLDGQIQLDLMDDGEQKKSFDAIM